MKKFLIEYHPNSIIKKHEIIYYDNDSKNYELFYYENGALHREDDLPAFQSWHENGILRHKAFLFYGDDHNINNPANIYFLSNGKISGKMYCLKNRFTNYTKLAWMNQIKKI